MKVWPWRESVNTTSKVQAQFYSRAHIISSWWNLFPLSVISCPLCHSSLLLGNFIIKQVCSCGSKFCPVAKPCALNGYLFCVPLCDGHSGVATRGDTGKTQKNKVHDAPSFQGRCHHVPPSVTGDMPGFGQISEDRSRKPRLGPLLGFLQERQSRAK